MKPFEKWLTQEIKQTFNLEEVKNHPILTHWLSSDELVTDEEKRKIELLRQRLEGKINYWNEDELKFFFISEYVNIVSFINSDIYSSFSQRTISATAKDVKGENITLRGRVEWMVATGEQVPLEPFFFIHEYKPQIKSTPNDPQGQLLISMYATQQINTRKHPLYGIYVLGRLWYFVVLKGQEFSVSAPFDVLRPNESVQIIAILKKCKIYIETELGLI